MLALNTTDTMTEVVRESFRQAQDGYFYPLEPGTPLVRVIVGGGAYSIERRRHEHSPWMPLVTAEAAEFDASAFRLWRERWPVVA